MMCRVRWMLPDLRLMEDTEALVKELQSKGQTFPLASLPGNPHVCTSTLQGAWCLCATQSGQGLGHAALKVLRASPCMDGHQAIA